MSPAEAATLLQIDADASPDKLEARYNELRGKLEEKITHAATPGLRDKYRATLENVTTAYECLVLNADATELPVRVSTGTQRAPAKATPAAIPPTIRAVDTPPPPAPALAPLDNFFRHLAALLKGGIILGVIGTIAGVSLMLLLTGNESIDEGLGSVISLGTALVLGLPAGFWIWRRSLRKAAERLAAGGRNRRDQALVVGSVSLTVCVIGGSIALHQKMTHERASAEIQYAREQIDRELPDADRLTALIGSDLAQVRADREKWRPDERAWSARPADYDADEVREARAYIAALENYQRWLERILAENPTLELRARLELQRKRLDHPDADEEAAQTARKTLHEIVAIARRLDFERHGRQPDRNAMSRFDRLQKAATQGDPEAMYELHSIYASGQGAVEPDMATAIRWLETSANAGFPKAIRTLAFNLMHGEKVAKDEAAGMRWYRKGAEAGDPESMNSLAFYLFRGDGAPVNEAEAMRWYLKSAELGNAEAMHTLAYNYSTGRGVAPDEAKALDWWRKSAALGNDSARRELQIRGQPVPQLASKKP